MVWSQHLRTTTMESNSILSIMIFVTVVISEAFGSDPCTDYQELNQARRSSAAEVAAGHSLLCDNTLSAGWYRFISYVGGEIPTTCVEPYHCGTQVPIWMDGTLPTDSTVVNRTVCTNYGVPGDCCTSSWNIQVKRCVETQGVFYVYDLVPTFGCSQAYCAGTLPLCPEGEVYDQYNNICLETRHPVPCDFESIGTCEWHQQTTDDFDWAKQTAGNGNHLPTDGGRFLYVGTEGGQQPLDTARIIGPVIVPSVVQPCNMTFSYYFSGPDAGDLDVLTRQYYTGVQKPEWQQSAGTAEDWTQVTVSFQEQDPFQVIIQGVLGYGRDAKIAIDDISFSWDCVREVDGSVRLVDGARFDEGRVEIYYNHRWGTICNIGWTRTSADVVCAQLGYRASVWTDTRYPAPDSTPILLDDVTCDSRNKSRITECRTKPWENWSPLCNHDRDVSVRCVGQWHQCTPDQFVCDNAVCLPPTAQCDFTNDCGDGSDEGDCGRYPGRCDFQNNLCNWVQLKSDTADWTRGFGGSEAGVPLVDHQGLTDGYFLYVTAAKETTAFLLLPTFFISSGNNCSLLFHYYLDIDDANLSVRIASRTNARIEWQQSVSQGPNWVKQEVPIPDRTPFQVSFQGSIGTPSPGSIAIDDITLTPGCIIEYDGCTETSFTFKCGSGECISLDYVCDFQVNCVDGSDERLCDKEPGRCDFEEGFCSWSSGPSDIEFQRGRESTSTSGTGPPVDHTHQNPLGFYIFIDSSDNTEGQKAQLVSPVITDGSPCQFRFFYHMQGRNIGSLRVLVRNVEDESTQEVWRREGQQGRGWLFASVNIGTNNRKYQVVLEAIVGNGDQGDIAVDDVSFATYCPLHAEGKQDGLSSTSVIIIAVSIVAVVITGIVVTVITVYCRRKRIKKERYGNNTQNNSHQLGRLPARPQLEDSNVRTYEDLRRSTANNYESLHGAGGRPVEWSVTPRELKGQVEPDGAYAIPAYASSKDLFTMDSSSQASLVNNIVDMAATGKSDMACENNYTLLVDDRLQNFLKINGFVDCINIMAENQFTYETLQSCTEVDLINIGIPLAKAHAILSALRSEGDYENTRSNELVPSKYICPISNSVMREPVRSNDGCIYDRAAITAWYDRNGSTPNMKVSTLDLQTVDDLRQEIDQFRKRRQKRVNGRQTGHDARPDSAQSDSSRCATPMTDVDC
ncbi:PREDICTED: MAM and LDL-receptor class A domain-containing protein 1-like isoform X1 [Branchiostoma belcheri]|uniref:MAM and LDL-receptor class A domain-containing protein 1-like isoform X1 n=1 Tax=Branchiostoma belcheri TaxID=7741 RepID=A0A6P4YAJ2_BRABE|nr:PREDICTED: MAM and LDL-receptor class A domain-containing protein 1-like isoform X1 [Branchiostoma belcheri]